MCIWQGYAAAVKDTNAVKGYAAAVNDGNLVKEGKGSNWYRVERCAKTTAFAGWVHSLVPGAKHIRQLRQAEVAGGHVQRERQDGMLFACMSVVAGCFVSLL